MTQALAIAVVVASLLGMVVVTWLSVRPRRRPGRLARMSVTVGPPAQALDLSAPPGWKDQAGVLLTAARPMTATERARLIQQWEQRLLSVSRGAIVLSDMPGDVYTLPAPPWCAWCLRDHRDDRPSRTCAGCGAPRPYDVAPRPPPRPPAPPPTPTVRLWG